MPTLVPLFIPGPIVTERGLRLDADFTYEPVKLAWDSRGRLLALTPLFYNYYRYDNNDTRHFGTYVVNAYERDLSPAFIVETSKLWDEIDEESGFRWSPMDVSLVVGADENIAITTHGNHAFFFDPEFDRRVRDWHAIAPRFAADGLAIINSASFACDAEPIGDGRFLCVLGLAGTNGDSRYAPNLICISDGSPLSSESRPMLDCFTCITSYIRGYESQQLRTYPHVRFPGDDLPAITIDSQVKLHFPWLGQALPLDGERFLITAFHKLMKSGTKGMPFTFAIVDRTGKILVQLSGIDQKEESPYVEHHYRVGIDRARSTILYKNKACFFVFDFAGALRAKVSFDSTELKPLAAWHLSGVAPDGRVILSHKKQHLLLAIDAFDPAEGALREALCSAANVLKKERALLKKRFAARDAHYLHPGPVKRHS